MTEGGNGKFLATRFSEHLKRLATLFNASSIATFGAAFVVPLAQGQDGVLGGGHWILIVAALARHLAGHAAILIVGGLSALRLAAMDLYRRHPRCTEAAPRD